MKTTHTSIVTCGNKDNQHPSRPRSATAQVLRNRSAPNKILISVPSTIPIYQSALLVNKPTCVRFEKTVEGTSSAPTRGLALTRADTSVLGPGGARRSGVAAVGVKPILAPGVCGVAPIATAWIWARRSSSALAAASSLRARSSASASASKKLGSGGSRKKNHGVSGTMNPIRRPCRIDEYMPSDDAAD